MNLLKVKEKGKRQKAKGKKREERMDKEEGTKRFKVQFLQKQQRFLEEEEDGDVQVEEQKCQPKWEWGFPAKTWVVFAGCGMGEKRQPTDGEDDGQDACERGDEDCHRPATRETQTAQTPRWVAGRSRTRPRLWHPTAHRRWPQSQ